jgi:hypothetical protein
MANFRSSSECFAGTVGPHRCQRQLSGYACVPLAREVSGGVVRAHEGAHLRSDSHAVRPHRGLSREPPQAALTAGEIVWGGCDAR